MPIEYRCVQCNKLLRVADAAAGKKGKCPHCGAVGDIPTASTSASDSPQPSSGTADANPFADPAAATSASAGPWSGQPANPYMSPAATAIDYSAKPVAGGRLTPTRVDMNELFSRTWQILQPQMGQGVLFALLMIGLGIAGQVVAQPLAFAQQAMQDEPAAVGILIFLQQVWGFVYQVFTTIVAIRFALNFARSSPSPFDGIFSIGPYFLPLLVQQFLIALMMFGITILCAIPIGLAALSQQPEIVFAALAICVSIGIVIVVVVSMMFFLAGYFVIDAKMGAIEALKASKTFMAGNKLAVFLTMLITGILGGLFVIATCCIGILFYAPYLALLGAVVYLSATGQFASGQPTATGQYRY